MSASPHILPVREKIGYALGDVATNFFFQSMILYQTRFYTDTVGLSASAVGWMFLILRLADAFVDPVVGALSDRTNTRWGKFRPWILWTALPFGLIFWAVYITPNVGMTGKLIYAYITYVLVMMFYSANNTPYAALMGVMTPDVSERANIARYRFVGALVGQFLIQALALPLVDKFGQGDSAKGWAITMAIFGGAIVICSLAVFLSTKERVLPPPEQKPSLKEDIKSVVGCKPWLAMFILTLMIFTMLVVRGSLTNYFFTYYMDPNAIRSFLDNFGLAAVNAGETVSAWRSVLNALGLQILPDASNASGVGQAFFFVIGSIVQIFCILISKPLADRFGKKTVFIVGFLITIAATCAVFWVPPTAMTALFWLSIIWGLGWGPTVPLLWVMIADVADYSEWQTSRRATGFTYAGILFALKAGLGLGGALSGWIVGLYGYVPNVAQTEHSLLGIRLGASIYSAVPLLVGLVCLIYYPITKALNLQIQNELEARREKAAAKT
ncbi:MFS transporter [Opitutus terrae]|uniref:Sugar (Glycoside-Pentoside-Hexuronide) transporter n=1 Tax=Opitutus terrae (strain DSM 11246 / JCM 15787 / PB90-1) TaxID=452637 RepID=B1ZP96_OPITP|nr:MFS transporter [Opitutus terrae]ACB77585.1 sugar (Glycoside-Pentoside-Hexuronide) transporter [Opitutus terrae PB90-1]